MVYFTELLMGFIPAEWKDDGTYTETTWPIDAVLLSVEEEAMYWKQTPPDGKRLGAIDGRPAWIDLPPPTEAQLLAIASAKLQTANQLASAQKTALTDRIGVINDAIEFEEATPAELTELPVRQAQLTAWKRYAILLGRVTAQPGWYATVDWPVQPDEGMDLTVSAASPETV